MLGQMKLNARVTAGTVALAKRITPLRLTATRRPDGRLVIGYGHTRYAREGAAIGEPDADMLLRFDLSEAANALDAMIAAPLDERRYQALNVFALEVGMDQVRQSGLAYKLDAGRILEAADQIGAWPNSDVLRPGEGADDLAEWCQILRTEMLGDMVPAAPPQPAYWQPASAAPTVGFSSPSNVGCLPSYGDSQTPDETPRWRPPPRQTPVWSRPSHKTPALRAEAQPIEPFVHVETTAAMAPVALARQSPVVEPSQVEDFAATPTLFNNIVMPPELQRTSVSDVEYDARQEPRPLLGSTAAFIVLGLLGVMLFAGAVVSMLRHASLANLLAGMVGVLFMAPSAGHILFALISPASGNTARNGAPELQR